jgi:hypothetical protein
MELFGFILVTIGIIVPIVAYGGICLYRYIVTKKRLVMVSPLILNSKDIKIQDIILPLTDIHSFFVYNKGGDR